MRWNKLTMRFWTNSFAHLFSAVLAARVFWLGFFGQHKYSYIEDAFTLILVSMLVLIHFFRWLDLGNKIVEVDVRSALEIRRACAALGVQMYQGFWYFIKPIPNATLLEAAARVALKKKTVVDKNFDLYRVIFMTPGFLQAIFLSLLIFLGGVFLGPAIFAKGAWRAFAPLTPLVMLICWGFIVYSICLIFLYVFILIQGRR
jgi:hypothetical protein